MTSWKERIARLFYPTGATRRVLRGPLRGFRYIVKSGMGATYALGVDSGGMKFLQQKAKPGLTVYDVGANRGQMCLLFSKLVGPDGRVFAFEPVPPLAASIARNIQLNSLTNVWPHAVALSDHDGVDSFAFSWNYSTQGKLADVEATYLVPDAVVQEVDVARLDTFVAQGQPPPQLMKIDAEGAAAAILRGGAEVLETYSPSIYLELHGPEEQAGVQDELLSRGYLCETLDGTRVEDPTDGWHSPLWCYRD